MNFMWNWLKNIFDHQQRQLKRLKPIVAEINGWEAKIKALSNAKLKEKTAEFRSRLAQGEREELILPEAFAVVREAARRTLQMRHYDVQLMAGIVLHEGKIAEQKTGEGKTLSATLALYLNALTGQGAHLVTVNDYLARRDCEWMGPIFHLLGLTVGCLNHEQAYLFQPPAAKEKETINPAHLGRGDFLVPVTRQEAYRADITYGTNNEFGFDYLRDNMVYDLSEMVQTCPRGDYGVHHFAIVDEVDFLLIDQARTPLIISIPQEESNELYLKFARLVPQLLPEYYEIDEKRKTVHLTELGIAKIEKLLGVKNLYQNFALVHHLEQAIRAYKLFQRDRDYIVQDNQVIIVDEFTGRLMPGRRYAEGLHQAIEAKEGVPIQKESKTLATITFQNYFRLYQKLAGMTGTAITEAEEFQKIYNLEVVVIPTHRPVIRRDYADRIYKNQRAKYAAIIAEIKEKYQQQQPVLIGTTSVEKNELISKLLKRHHIPHQVLNAKNHQREAEIIARAGEKGAVTVATNLAGRGTDIKLGPGVKELGGLHVIGTERHEARRIDLQLRGRSGRQGDPGSSRFYVALDDDLMRIFGGEQIARLMERFNFPEDQPIEHPLISKQIAAAQKRVEGFNFDLRKHLVEYDDVINKQREIIYQLRRQILTNQGIEERIARFLEEKGAPLKTKYEEKMASFSPAERKALPRLIYLQTLDQLWMDHIDLLDELRRGVQLRGYAQRDPLVEFKNEAFQTFKTLMERLDQEAITRLLRIEVISAPTLDRPQITNLRAEQEKISYTIPSSETNGTAASSPTQPFRKSEKQKLGRNDPCWCGSGKKYKKCHGRG